MIQKFIVVTVIASLLGLAACKAPPPAPDAPSVAPDAPIAEHSCFWTGPWVAEDTERGYAYPDTGAAYWAARFTLPQDGQLELTGDFAYARYTSFVLYQHGGEPADSLHDVDIQPDPNSHNPFVEGAERDARPRHWRVQISSGDAPAQRAPNHLYAGAGEHEVAMLYRVYVPDMRYGRTGGVPLPQIHLIKSDGSVQDESASCGLIAANDKPMTNTVPPPAGYALLRDRALQPKTFPADDPPQWHAFYDAKQLIACTYLKNCNSDQPRKGGVYSNPDNAYLWMMINRGFGPLLILQGRMPRIEPTLAGGGRVRANDLRYWSLCNYEAYTQRAMGCVFDEQVPLDAQRRYTVVVSRKADRPANATEQCGVAWIEWTDTGDGAGHHDDGMLFLRNMLASPTFTQAVQNTARPGDESAVMGDYLPQAQYGSVAEFEKRGCAAKH